LLLRRTVMAKKEGIKKAGSRQLQMQKNLSKPLLSSPEGVIEKQNVRMAKSTLNQIFPPTWAEAVILYKPGDKVEIQRSNGKWQKATVYKVMREEGSYRCHFTKAGGEPAEKDVPISCDPPKIRLPVSAG